MDFKIEFEQLIQDKLYEEARLLLEKNHIHALEDPFYYANMGWILNQLERHDEALICLKKGLVLFPGDGWMYSQIAYAHDRLGNITEGLYAMDQAFDLGFDEPWMHGEKGWCYKELKQYDQAIMCFEDALLDDADNSWLLSQAAYTYLEMQEYEQAEEYFLKCYRLDYSDDAIYDLIFYYKQRKAYQKVIEVLVDHKSEDYHAWVHFELGNAYHEVQEEEKAKAQVIAALQEGKDDTGSRTLLGDIYVALSAIEEAREEYHLAISYYQKALERDDHADAEWIWQEIIWLSHKGREYDIKLALLTQALQQFPDNVWLLYHKAETYSALDRYEEAAKSCEECIAHDDNSKEVLDLYAWSLGRLDRGKDAIDAITKRCELYGEDDWTLHEVGWNYARLKEYTKALEYFEKACSSKPENNMHVSMVGWCYLRLERPEEALRYLVKALTLGRKDGWMYATLGEVYMILRNPQEALSHFEEALKLQYDDEWLCKQIEKANQMLDIIQEDS